MRPKQFIKKIHFTDGDIKNTSQILYVLGASFSFLLMGLVVAWPSPAILKMTGPDYNITVEEASYLTIIDPIAMIIASPLFPRLADRMGRKGCMLILPVLIVACFLITAVTKSIYILGISRIFAGLVYACAFSTLPTYIGEITTPEIRSKYGHLMMTMVFIGQFLPNLTGYFCDIPQMAYVFMSLAVIGQIIFIFLPETPYYYAMKNNQLGARRSLEKLRGTKNVDEVFHTITTAVQEQLTEPGRLKDLFVVPSNRKALIICVVTRGVQQLCGISAFVYYTQYLFEEANIDISSAYASMIFSGVFILFNVFSNVVYDRVGKRLAMVYSTLGIFIALVGEAIFFFLKEYSHVDVSPVNWFPVFGLTLYVASFCVGQANVPTLILGELFSSKIKQYGVMIMNITFAIYLAGMNKAFQSLISICGLTITFSTLATVAFIGIFVSYYVIPETKGKTLEEIQIMLKGN